MAKWSMSLYSENQPIVVGESGNCYMWFHVIQLEPCCSGEKTSPNLRALIGYNPDSL